MKKAYGLVAGALIASLGTGGSVMAADDVDLELSLVVDTSGSINSSEYDLQMDGYEAAFLNTDVQDSIAAAPKGVAVNLIFFSTSAKVGIPFTVLRSAADATAFAASIAALSRPGDIGTLTDIHEGIDLAVSSIFGNDIDSDNQVIDVSGDGFPSTGETTSVARDDAVTAGVDIINALAVGTSVDASFFDDNVIAGTGAQTFVALAFEDFEGVVTNKINFEIRDNTPKDPPSGIPTPTAAFAGLALLGVVGARRRRSA